MGSSPFFLRNWGDFNPHVSFYQNGPWVFGHNSWCYSCGGSPANAIGRAMCHNTRARVRGKKFFQTKCMSWSYRNRGYEARTHRKMTDRSAAFVMRLVAVSSGSDGRWDAPKNRIVESVFMSRMLAYSARKNRAKGPPAYSTLKPETSSDSPSVRSNGARFVSASVEIYHMAARGQAGTSSQMLSWAVLNVCRVKPPVKIITERRISPRLTS